MLMSINVSHLSLKNIINIQERLRYHELSLVTEAKTSALVKNKHVGKQQTNPAGMEEPG